MHEVSFCVVVKFEFLSEYAEIIPTIVCFLFASFYLFLLHSFLKCWEKFHCFFFLFKYCFCIICRVFADRGARLHRISVIHSPNATPDCCIWTSSLSQLQYRAAAVCRFFVRFVFFHTTGDSFCLCMQKSIRSGVPVLKLSHWLIPWTWFAACLKSWNQLVPWITLASERCHRVMPFMHSSEGCDVHESLACICSIVCMSCVIIVIETYILPIPAWFYLNCTMVERIPLLGALFFSLLYILQRKDCPYSVLSNTLKSIWAIGVISMSIVC